MKTTEAIEKMRDAKGGKDRFVSLPCSLVPEITAQLAHAKAVGERDRLAAVPVALPGFTPRR